jgi:septal ring factor EnvC (AmiA/AmiB activator)
MTAKAVTNQELLENLNALTSLISSMAPELSEVKKDIKALSRRVSRLEGTYPRGLPSQKRGQDSLTSQAEFMATYGVHDSLD